MTVSSPPAFCTTKGLNQIITPDIQAFGVLSLSAQIQDALIGNPDQLQFELGLSRDFEIAVFQGAKPVETVLNAELSLYHRGPNLLSTGVANWSMRGVKPQPFLEYGWYGKLTHLMAGVIRTGSPYLPILGASYQVNPLLVAQADYLGGAENFTTLGFTYSATPALTINPALYIQNGGSHRLAGYVVFTWNVTLWK